MNDGREKYAFRLVDPFWTKDFDDLEPETLSQPGGSYLNQASHGQSFRLENILEVETRAVKRGFFGSRQQVFVKCRLFFHASDTGVVTYVRAEDLIPAEAYKELRKRFPELPEASEWPAK